MARYSRTFLQTRMIFRTSDSSNASSREDVPCKIPENKPNMYFWNTDTWWQYSPYEEQNMLKVHIRKKNYDILSSNPQALQTLYKQSYPHGKKKSKNSLEIDPLICKAIQTINILTFISVPSLKSIEFQAFSSYRLNKMWETDWLTYQPIMANWHVQSNIGPSFIKGDTVNHWMGSFS